MHTILQNGTTCDYHLLTDDYETFYIQRNDNVLTYRCDSIVHQVDDLISDLFNKTLFQYIPREEFEETISSMPIWISEAGISSHCLTSKNQFLKLIHNSIISN